MSQNSSIRDTFFEECQDLLEALDEGLSAIEEGDRNPETINAVFRAVHSIKGGAGAFGLTQLVEFAHTFETVFDEVRSEKLELDESLVRLLIRAADHLVDLVEAARVEEEAEGDYHQSVLDELNGYLDTSEEEEEVEFEAMELDFSPQIEIPEAVIQKYSIQFSPLETLYRNGHEPFLLFKALAELGHVSASADFSSLPALQDVSCNTSDLSWSLELESDCSEADISEVFDFVQGLCELSIGGETEDYQDAPNQVDAATEKPLSQETDETVSETPQKEVSNDQPKKGEAKEGKAKVPSPSLRVDPDRVDRLINTVGELIINQSMLAQRVSQLQAEDRREIEGDLEDYKLLARDIQEGVMAIRAQPVKPLFRRMARIAREAAHATGKSIRFDAIGEGTEVDKTVIEGLVDPLTHMIRNAVDHGIETPDRRSACGKPETGLIEISAAHRSGSVYIEIRDDGAGLNREKILDIAISKGLVPKGQEFSEGEIDNLLFLPGFSTANEVSNLSGRGVGMDVVKNAVLSLGGRTSISSKSGEGTTFSIVLPLTLAVMDGMVITVADQTMVVPISSIVETIRPNESDVHRLDADERLLSIRGTFVPVIEVAEQLNISRPNERNEEVFLLVETPSNEQTALSVDAIHDQRQVVVKSLEAAYGRVPGISAATILGDGQIAMILDPESMAQISFGSEHRDTASGHKAKEQQIREVKNV